MTRAGVLAEHGRTNAAAASSTRSCISGVRGPPRAGVPGAASPWRLDPGNRIGGKLPETGKTARQTPDTCPRQATRMKMPCKPPLYRIHIFLLTGPAGLFTLTAYRTALKAHPGVRGGIEGLFADVRSVCASPPPSAGSGSSTCDGRVGRRTSLSPSSGPESLPAVIQRVTLKMAIIHPLIPGGCGLSVSRPGHFSKGASYEA